MLDAKWIRENIETLAGKLKARGMKPDKIAVTIKAILDADVQRRSHIVHLQGLQERRNTAAKAIGKAVSDKNNDLADSLKASVQTLKDLHQVAELRARDSDREFDELAAVLPNMPFEDVPVGPDESGNVVIRTWGAKPEFDFQPKEHFDLGEAMGLMDFHGAAKIAGSRFTILKGGLAKLERALGQFMLDLHTTQHGYTEVTAPLLVRDEVMFGTGQLPKFEEDLFKTTDGRWLIPTAEVSLTNLVREEIVDSADLPIRMTALTPCFRSEAGSAGRDQRGMLRQHQFNKVELVVVTDAERALEEHERMTASAEEVLKRLGLHFRTVLLCTGDMGFSARKTYDLEVWLPGQNAYREISSISVCGDFQARRMNARYRKQGAKNTEFLHTLNGSGVAVGRALIAVMENYQNNDGTVMVPEQLRPYVGNGVVGR